jgi:hypothetical protein
MSDNSTHIFDMIKQSLPNFPDEIIETWLLPYALMLGWPPIPQHKKDPNNRWRYILTKKDLTYWQNIEWKLELVNISKSCLDDNSKQQIMIILSPDGELHTPENLNKVIGIANFLFENIKLPHPPIALRNNEKIYLVDGNHRVCALLLAIEHLENAGMPVEHIPTLVWLGTEPN